MKIKLYDIQARRGFIKDLVATGTAMSALPSLLSAMNPKPSGPSSDEDARDFIFLFQGDSITDGNRTRYNDQNHVMGHGYAYMIDGKLSLDHPKKNFRFFNRGTSGNRIVDLQARWQSDALDIKPDVLSILIGVNDVNVAVARNEPIRAGGKEEDGLMALLQQTKQNLPGVQIVLCEPFILKVNKVKEKWQEWSDSIQVMQQIVRRAAAEQGTILVELQDLLNKACVEAPPEYWLWDGVHPMPAGHELIARTWIKTVGNKLHFIK